MAVNGSHLAADGNFIEKRRRGLVRFVNALVRHPVLEREQLVIMFLTVPTVSFPPFPCNKRGNTDMK
jgi:sorting nexin-8